MKKDTVIKGVQSLHNVRVAWFFSSVPVCLQNQCLFPRDFEGVGVRQAPKPEARTAPAVRDGKLGDKKSGRIFTCFNRKWRKFGNTPSTAFDVKVAR